MSRKALAYVTAVAIATGVILDRRNRKLIANADSKAVASVYYGAMSVYGNLATYFGRKAMAAETEYWKVVNDATGN